eukprot:12390706-Karenia_brevis.AAC.1
MARCQPDKMQFYRWRTFVRKLYREYISDEDSLVETLREEAARLIDSDYYEEWQEPSENDFDYFDESWSSYMRCAHAAFTERTPRCLKAVHWKHMLI